MNLFIYKLYCRFKNYSKMLLIFQKIKKNVFLKAIFIHLCILMKYIHLFYVQKLVINIGYKVLLLKEFIMFLCIFLKK